jgi:hypothetical protein
MGNGSYSIQTRSVRATTQGYHTKSINEIFSQRKIENGMDPNGLTIRESRDSIEHPNSIAILVGLDVTGSMGQVPYHLVKDGLPHIMQGIIDAGIADPQLLFMGIGDHKVDEAPLQVGQFESSDALLDHWLTRTFLEGGGGGNGGESYHLAWYIASKHTSIDCFEKRQQKGFLFTIGDEPCHTTLSSTTLKNLIKTGEFQNHTAAELLAAAREKYHVYHINIQRSGRGCEEGWENLIGRDNLLRAERHEDVAGIITRIVSQNAGVAGGPVNLTSGL